MPVLQTQRHEDTRHQRKVKGHVALVAFAEIGAYVGRPLVGFGQKHPPAVAGFQFPPDAPDHFVGLAEVLAVGALALHQVGNRVQTHAVGAEIKPETHGLHYLVQHGGIIEIQVRLVREEAMPVVGLRFRIPCPVGFLGVGEDDARVAVFLVRVAPDVEIAFGRAGRGFARGLEPGMLVGSMVDDKFNQNLQPAFVRGSHEPLEIVQRAVARVDVAIVGNVVPVVAQRRREEGQQPQAGDAEILQIIQLLGEAGEVADPVIVTVEERLDVGLVDDGVLVPQRVLRASFGFHLCSVAPLTRLS